MMLPLFLNTSHRQRKRIASISLLFGICLLQFYNAIFDTSSSYGGGVGNTVDYDHYVPGHRFLFVDQDDEVIVDTESDGVSSTSGQSPSATNEDGEEGNNSNNDQEGEEETSQTTFSWSGSSKHVTLVKRSEEDSQNIRRRAILAAKKRTGHLDDDEYASITPEVASSITSTANDILYIPPERQVNVTSYDIDSALLAVRAFHKEILFFVYDSATDDFVIVHNLPNCNWGCKRAYIVAPVLAYALRKNYPQRFQGAKSGDLLFLLSVGDMPRIRRPCLFEDNKYCKSENWAPILQFGSVLVDTKYMPSVIAMPQSPRPHIPCVDEYQSTGRICQDLLPRVMADEDHQGPGIESTGQHFKHGLVYGQMLNLVSTSTYWDDLIPQVIWRGTDFTFLHTLYPDMRTPTYEEDIQPYEEVSDEHAAIEVVARSAIKSLWNMGQDKLTPRWRGVLLTSEAELDLRQDMFAQQEQYDINYDDASSKKKKLPWVNIKFATCNVGGKKVPSSQNPEFQRLQNRFGITAIGNSMTMIEQANYKYHIDLGGGGGTTWTGTIEKLALPGVLFRHVTPTKDWFHDHLVPWVHYIPVSVDLSDLRAKFDWAESHPEETRRIAEAGTEFARRMGSLDGYAQLYQEHIVHPLGNIITAYKTPRKKYHGLKTLDILKEAGDGNFGIVARCGGWPAERSRCRWTMKDFELGEEDDVPLGLDVSEI